MTAKLLSIITAVLAVVTVLAALDLTGLVTLIPGGNAAMVTWVSGGLATLGTILRAIGDLLDDGQANGSYGKLRMHPGTFLLACALAVLAVSLSSCSGVLSGVTGVPLSSVPVQRVGGDKPFQVAASDVFQAEAQPGVTWGLYNAGAVASATSQVVDSGK